MGYYADTVDNDFTVPATNVAAALAAIQDAFGGTYDSLADAVEDLTTFQDCEGLLGEDFVLGYHCDKFLTDTDHVLAILGQFATEGSYVRFCGEDHSLFGYRVINGKLRTESGDLTWALDAQPTTTDTTEVTR